MSIEYLSRCRPGIVPDSEYIVNLSKRHLKPPKNKSKTKTSEWDEKITEITAAICALFNSETGGLLRLSFDDECSAIKVGEPKTVDDLVRRIEQSVINFAGIATASDAFKLQESPKDDHDLVFVVKPATQFCTIEYNLYLPTDFQVSPISFGDSSRKVASLLEPGIRGNAAATFKKHCQDFRYKDKVPTGLREGQTVQFKLLKDDPTSNVTLADRMTNKSNKLVNYVSAFANHEGGHIYFGVDDTTYIVEGQVTNLREQNKIKKRVLNVLSKMIWPVKDHGRFWRLEFVPVLMKGEPQLDRFVIVLSVARCPGGVFVAEPESYYMADGRVTRTPLSVWKQALKADANGEHRSLFELIDPRKSRGRVGVSLGVVAKGWNSAKQEDDYMRVTQLMENLRNNGNWSEINRMAARILVSSNKNADLKLAVTFQCTAAAYRQGKHKAAYDFLQSYHELIGLAKNPAIFEVQELYSWSAIKRSERNYQESFQYTYDALQKMQLIAPGWITAWFLCNAASLLTIFASEATDPKAKTSFISEAECYYRKALEHGQSIVVYEKAAANLQHRVHINLAMLYMALSPNVNRLNYDQTVSHEHLRSAQESLNAAENLEGPPMSGFNEFHFLLAKSDLYFRHFQLNTESSAEYMKKAIRYANDASAVAVNNDFAEVLHYAQSRITLLERIPQQEQNVTDIVDGLLNDITL